MTWRPAADESACAGTFAPSTRPIQRGVSGLLLGETTEGIMPHTTSNTHNDGRRSTVLCRECRICFATGLRLVVGCDKK